MKKLFWSTSIVLLLSLIYTVQEKDLNHTLAEANTLTNPSEKQDVSGKSGLKAERDTKKIVKGKFSGNAQNNDPFTVAGIPQLWRIQAIGKGVSGIALLNAEGKVLQKLSLPGGARRARLPNQLLVPGTYRVVAEGKDGSYTIIILPIGPHSPDVKKTPETTGVKVANGKSLTDNDKTSESSKATETTVISDSRGVLDFTDVSQYTNLTDVASSQHGATVGNMSNYFRNTYNRAYRAVDDIADDPYYANVELEKPGLIFFPKVFKLHRIEITLQLTEKNESFRFRVESTLDGKSWTLLQDFTDKDYQGHVAVELNSVESAAIRLVGQSSTVDNILQIKEVDAFTSDHVPDFQNNLALSRFGGTVIAATKGIENLKVLGGYRGLLDGDTEYSYSLDIGKEEEAITLNLAGSGPVSVDAVQLLVKKTKPLPPAFEVLYSATDAGDDFLSAGTFSFFIEHSARLAVLDTPKQARRIKVFFPKTGNEADLAEIRVLESVAPGTPSILDSIGLRSAEVRGDPEPIRGKDLAHPRQGATFIQYPQAQRESWETVTEEYYGEITQFPATFELDFYGKKAAKLEQLRLQTDDSSDDIKLNIYAINGEETTLVNSQPLLVPTARGWWKTSLSNLEAEGMKVEFLVDAPNDNTH